MSKHTPRPWTWTNEPSDACCWDHHVETVGSQEDREDIADVNGEANARLIAAAPDMLEALKDCLRLASWDDQRRLNISRVNNREGTSEAIQIARKTAVELRGRIEKSIRKARVAISKAEGK